MAKREVGGAMGENKGGSFCSRVDGCAAIDVREVSAMGGKAGAGS